MAERKSVKQRIDEIVALLDIDRTLHAPPTVRFIWGPLRFDAVFEKLGRKNTMFRPDGTPARATLSVSFKEFRTLCASSTRRGAIGGQDEAPHDQRGRDDLADRRQRIWRPARLALWPRQATSTIHVRCGRAIG